MPDDPEWGDEDQGFSELARRNRHRNSLASLGDGPLPRNVISTISKAAASDSQLLVTSLIVQDAITLTWKRSSLCTLIAGQPSTSFE